MVNYKSISNFSDDCPEDYPWAFGEGEFCSSSWKEDQTDNIRTCDGSIIHFNSTCSLDPSPLKCTNPPCKTNAAVCPGSHPFAYLSGDYCCSEPLEKDTEESEHDGNRCFGRMMTWDSSCCKDSLPSKCTNPPCRDASIANQAKLDFFFEHLPEDKYEMFFKEDVFVVQKGWHDKSEQISTENSNLIRQKREILPDSDNTSSNHTERQSTTAEKISENEEIVPVTVPIINTLNKTTVIKEDLMIPHNKNITSMYDKNSDNTSSNHTERQSTTAAKISENEQIVTVTVPIINTLNKTTVIKQDLMIPHNKNITSMYDQISALRKVLGESYKCRADKCKKYSKDFENGNTRDIPSCLDPWCFSREGLNSNVKIAVDIMDENISTNLIFTQQTPSSDGIDVDFSNPTTQILIVIGIVAVIGTCFCGCYCIVRDCLTYHAREKRNHEQSMKKELFNLTHRDGYLEREQRMQNDGNIRGINSTISTLCVSDNEPRFESRFNFHPDDKFPLPGIGRSTKMMDSNDKRIFRSNTVGDVRGSNLDGTIPGRGSVLYNQYYRSDLGSQQIYLKESKLEDPFVNNFRKNTDNQTEKLNEVKSTKTKILKKRREKRTDNIYNEGSVETLKKPDRTRSQSSSNLGPELRMDDYIRALCPSSSRSKGLQSTYNSDGTSSSSPGTKFQPTRYSTSKNLIAKDLSNFRYPITPSITSSGSATNSTKPGQNETNQLPPLPSIPTHTSNG